MCYKQKGLHNRIDPCIKNGVWILKKRFKINCIASCCGHFKYSPTIVIKDILGIYELFSGVDIPRTRKFYKKDKQGYYYIPEVCKEKK